MGKVIGKYGRNAQAIRTILNYELFQGGIAMHSLVTTIKKELWLYGTGILLWPALIILNNIF